MKAENLTVAIAILGVMTTTAGSARSQSYLPSLGGFGGSQFNEPCPAGQSLMGFELRAADDVDAVRAVCVIALGPSAISPPALTTDSGLVPAPLPGPFGTVGNFKQVAPGWHGGPGGTIQRVLCPERNPIVLGMTVVVEGVDTHIINSIHLFCGQPGVAQPVETRPSAIFDAPFYVESPAWLGIGMIGNSARRTWRTQHCAAGEVAVGMHGSSGKWLDAIGLICDAPRLASTNDGRPVVKAAGRVKGSTPAGPPLSICEAARAARERNSPAAPGLENRCRAVTPTEVPGGRVKSSASAGPPIPICDAALAARARNSPAAPGLEAQCRATGGGAALDRAAGPEVDLAEMALRGEVLAGSNSLSALLRVRQMEGAPRRGFDIGMAASEGQTAWGPGKQKILESLPRMEQEGFKLAVSFSLDLNRNLELAEIGAIIAQQDEFLSRRRGVEPDERYSLGFDIASAIFGDAGLGARGNTAVGPGSLAIRNALSATAQRGFDASMKLHLGRRY